MAMTEINVETRERTRQRVAAQFGFTQPRVEDVVKRENFNSDAEYVVALTQMKMIMSSPEYQKAARQSAMEAQQRREAETKKKQEKLFQKLRREATLTGYDEGNIEMEARRLATADYDDRKISKSEYGETVRRYTEELTDKAKNQKAENGVMNAIFRGQIEAMKEEDFDGSGYSEKYGKSFNDMIRDAARG